MSEAGIRSADTSPSSELERHLTVTLVMAARAVSLPAGGPGGGSTTYGGPGGSLRGAGAGMRGAGGGSSYSSGSAYAGSSSYAGGSGSDSSSCSGVAGCGGIGGARASPLLLSSSYTSSSTKETATGQTVVLETRVERVEVVESNNNNNNNDMANLNIDNNNNSANNLNDVVFLPMNG